ncbi:AcrR family transcriptional regulator [Actinoplanes octamycinicus]|uniref:AcrR family transcriptional regulator n=1 Tax=Actinoplanes octamycinicus TaxID=135948 RepID=A0A7W7M6D9_9ACTN|nr:TetR/AcrR family transcriptional regulator [Actinoplanes octamycinicus]MBB4738709.1 AcrR family transcriptional regulator [Actinoplanes octamycinicus]
MPAKRRDAEANRDRILRAAQDLLSRNPAASMDDLAQAAGVVRRTVYAHFPTRDALLDGLSDKVSTHLLGALGGTDRSGLEPEVALADFALTVWTVGAEYRLLMTLADADLGASRLHELLAPIRAQGLELLVRGRASGRFATHLPPELLTLALQGMTLSMIQAVNEGVWSDDGTAAATGVLIAAGLPVTAAEEAVARARNLKVAHD